jgi:hypothetical protein
MPIPLLNVLDAVAIECGSAPNSAKIINNTKIATAGQHEAGQQYN